LQSPALYRRHLWRVHSSRGRPRNAPAAFIHPCQPIVAKQPPTGPGWAHELKHDGYRLQVHVRDGRVRLYTINGNDWTKRYPRIVAAASRLRAPLIIDAEVVYLDGKGVPNFDTLHSRVADESAVALAFDLLLSGEDIRASARNRCSECFAKRAMVFSTSNTPKATARKCLKRFVSLDLKELSQRDSTRLTAQVRRERG
jgi:ATP dependent DNA ligase-like protein